MLKDTEDQGGNVIRSCPTFFLAIGGKSRRINLFGSFIFCDYLRDRRKED